MLPIPTDANCLVSSLGLDPGTETLGVGNITFDLLTFEIASCEAYTFKGSRLPGSEWMGRIYTDRQRRIAAHQQNFLRLLHRINPLIVSCESAYINTQRPAAYGALVEVQCALRETLRKFDQWRPLYMVEPSRAKAAVGASGGSRDKNEIKEALLRIPALVKTCLTPIETWDEHSVDAVAVAYCQYVAYRDGQIRDLLPA